MWITFIYLLELKFFCLFRFMKYFPMFAIMYALSALLTVFVNELNGSLFIKHLQVLKTQFEERFLPFTLIGPIVSFYKNPHVLQILFKIRQKK